MQTKGADLSRPLCFSDHVICLIMDSIVEPSIPTGNMQTTNESFSLLDCVWNLAAANMSQNFRRLVFKFFNKLKVAECSEFYIGECKTLRARMNLHRNHSNPNNIATPPLKVNQHLKTCAGGYFLVYPFHIVDRQHQITREAYERHFQQTLKPTLH